MSALPEGTWYEPRWRFLLDGEPWSTNGRIAIRGEAEAPGKDLSAAVRNLLLGCTEKTRLRRGDHWAEAEANGGVFAPYLLDLVEYVHGPQIEWSITPSSDALGPMAAHSGGIPVAVVMPRRGALGECECPWCHGKGFAEECSGCDGNGRVEHECTCGNLHEHDCNECDGEGGAGTCPRCEDSKVYRRPTEAATVDGGAP